MTNHLTAAGCRDRRHRLWAALDLPADIDALLLGDPLHLRYLANFYVTPFSLGGDSGGYLEVRRDGHATLFHDNRMPASVDDAHADARSVVPWYDGQTPGRGPRQVALADVGGRRVHDRPGDPLAAHVTATIADLRRRKDADEIEQLRACMAVGQAAMDWANANVQPGLTELEVYAGMQRAVTLAAGEPAVLYGDFAVSPGPERRGGPATTQTLAAGDLLILDFSVVLRGYRSDFTNTLAVGGSPTAEQVRLFDAAAAAMAAGEAQLKAGTACQAVYDAVRAALAERDLADAFPHHAGHGLGLAHPEAPFFVRESSETLVAGDVVTLEPGVYVAGVGGLRIEHNYLVTAAGFERLSRHQIALVPA